MNENEIKQVLEDVRYWLLEDERYPGEQESKAIAIQRLRVKWTTPIGISQRLKDNLQEKEE